MSLPRGMNGGADPTLIGKDQYSAACNMTVRGDYIHTRPPWANQIFTDLTNGRFTGRFQGAAFYDGEESGQSCHIISRGGRLFRLGANGMDPVSVLTEITPRITIQTTAQFTVPAPAATVEIDVTSESAIATGDIIYIDSGQYTVTNRSANQLLLTYIAGAASATVPAGSSILDSAQVQIREWRPNPSFLEIVFMCQAENYMLIFGGQHKTVAFDGSQARQLGRNELPPGVLGAYGWGRVWICLPDRRTFVAGDIAFGDGTRSNILNFTENDFLNEGGAFAVPQNSGPITSMNFMNQQDTSLGLGVLLVGTTNGVCTVNAPVDRTTWKNLNYPIQTISVLDYGPESPRATFPVNGDMFYRSQPGWNSFVTAHRYFNTPGNTPMSREISPLLNFDTPYLLFFGSGMVFDNRVLQTFSPSRTSDGIIHRGLAVLNLDLLSQISGKQPPAYEGAFTGLDIFSVYKGRINGNERAFFWANNDGVFEFWEILKNGYYDTYTTGSGDSTVLTRKSIEQWVESRADDFNVPFEKKKLYMGELYLDEIIDTVIVQAQFRPDQLPQWINWGPPITICANVSLCSLPANCAVPQINNSGYVSRITLPQPPNTCSDVGIPVDLGFTFQTRLNITGHARVRMFRTHAKLVPTPMEGGTVCHTTTCKTLTGCGTDWFEYNARGS